MITLWGARQSGKTIFLIALFHDILHNNKSWEIQPSDNRSAKFIDSAYRELTKERVFPGPSVTENPEQRLFNFDILIPGTIGRKQQDIRFDFLDPGGEIFEDPELDAAVYKNIVFNTIKESAGLIFLVDSTKKEQHEYISLFLKNFDKMKRTFYSERGVKKVPIPVALCVTKMDQENNFVNNPKKFDTDAYLRDLLGETAFRLVATNLKTFKVFGVSGLGWKKDGKRNYHITEDGKMRPAGELNPVHVMESVEWLLKNSGLR
jgi:GTPase SAR1 family protein